MCPPGKTPSAPSETRTILQDHSEDIIVVCSQCAFRSLGPPKSHFNPYTSIHWHLRPGRRFLCQPSCAHCHVGSADDELSSVWGCVPYGGVDWCGRTCVHPLSLLQMDGGLILPYDGYHRWSLGEPVSGRGRHTKVLLLQRLGFNGGRLKHRDGLWWE